MKYIRFFVLFPMLLLSILSYNYLIDDSYANDMDITAESAILIDAKTSQILYEKNSTKKMFPASTTKILTGIIAIENSNLNDRVIVDEDTPFEIEGSSIALEPYENLSMVNLLDGLFLASANDCASVIAKYIGDDFDGFSKLMNDKAKSIGAINSNFNNPHGLHDDNHYTTAYDLALISKYAMDNLDFRTFVSKVESSIPSNSIKKESRLLHNTNKLLNGTGTITVYGETVPIKYEGATGIKTGFTVVAQNCLVSSVKRDNDEYIVVIFKSNGFDQYADTHKLFNYAFENFNSELIATRESFNEEVSIGGSNISTYIEDDIILKLNTNTNKSLLTSSITSIEDISYPILQGDIVAYMNIFNDGTKVMSIELLSDEYINKKSILTTILDNNFILIPIIIIILVIIINKIYHFIFY